MLVNKYICVAYIYQFTFFYNVNVPPCLCMHKLNSQNINGMNYTHHVSLLHTCLRVCVIACIRTGSVYTQSHSYMTLRFVDLIWSRQKGSLH